MEAGVWRVRRYVAAHSTLRPKPFPSLGTRRFSFGPQLFPLFSLHTTSGRLFEAGGWLETGEAEWLSEFGFMFADGMRQGRDVEEGKRAGNEWWDWSVSVYLLRRPASDPS